VPTRKDVIVIGAGVVGCSIAYHLGRRGISTCIVDRESIAVRASGKAWAVFTYAAISVMKPTSPISARTLVGRRGEGVRA
jgi:glycine/D-amino acid oxidase-like deaminating enzyme